jgi:hypothetical protein
MVDCTKNSGISNVLRKVAVLWNKRSRAALLGATTLMSLSVFGPASTPAAAQQQQKPNILFIISDDIGWMQLGSYQ